jgi:hypothetical protein
MGLLNDAIREHLELKRQHGADPSEVARLEDEALGPVVRDHSGEERSILESHPETHQAGVGGDHESADAGSPADLVPAGQETAELDMQLLLGDGGGSPSDSLEWKVPDQSDGEVASDGDSVAADHDVDDVLEETPEFLQETPEHERLWFEQQPPRDFDFDN